jgi:hypothetical protein
MTTGVLSALPYARCAALCCNVTLTVLHPSGQRVSPRSLGEAVVMYTSKFSRLLPLYWMVYLQEVLTMKQDLLARDFKSDFLYLTFGYGFSTQHWLPGATWTLPVSPLLAGRMPYLSRVLPGPLQFYPLTPDVAQKQEMGVLRPERNYAGLFVGAIRWSLRVSSDVTGILIFAFCFCCVSK